ncbi:hypothetical protein EV102420_13_01370 [Pseudescherichia vulneris NBRC 102420]|uniref:Uncharacterized protein n=1 Tax=Pseudescherichia vulneris NBRC 102420 TaxID=1115515 RepID=A0A090V1X6_PSEVU|nr:hypothetical protein [Pseudescherichia vulneris]GAL58880.1 hypothetical protein EV102420_13_01370 [Pseudescherichia vulneris NBRC 102420]STQ58997.1 Uncharacterised protein [Pseudescherichia vulneris]
MHDALISERSVSTIKNSTSMIATLPLHHSPDSLEIRHLNSDGELKHQLFIITLKSDMEAAEYTVKPFAELMVFNKRLRFVVQPEKQYPDVAMAEEEIFPEIERSLALFLQKKYSVDVSLVRNKSSVKKRVANQWHLR